jgi:predicted RNase H-like HicB family nuclease
MLSHYVALIHKDEGSDFGVSFPDLPGCVSAGTTMQEAIVSAEEALRGHLSILVDMDQPIPEPTTIDEVQANPENRNAYAVLLSAPPLQRKMVKVSLVLPEDDLAAIDTFAEAHGQTRSGFMVSAAREVMSAIPRP